MIRPDAVTKQGILDGLCTVFSLNVQRFQRETIQAALAGKKDPKVASEIDLLSREICRMGLAIARIGGQTTEERPVAEINISVLQNNIMVALQQTQERLARLAAEQVEETPLLITQPKEKVA